MTVVVSIKVFDGIVIAADSATALELRDSAGNVVGHQVYNNVDKIFQLHRDLPIGAATWGTGQIQSASISTLAKDLRRRLMGLDKAHKDWKLVESSYSLAKVAKRLVELMFDELYSNWTLPSDQKAPVIGFLLAGYSGGKTHPEAWEVQLTDPTQQPVPTRVWDLDDSGWRAYGQPEAINRLFKGAAVSLPSAVAALVPPSKQLDLQAALAAEERVVAIPAMPFADAIELAKFAVQTTIGYTRFLPGSDLVGGPVDVAGISRHEGFKWVQRKHYYQTELNPRRPHEHDQ